MNLTARIEQNTLIGKIQVAIPLTVTYDSHIDVPFTAGEIIGTNRIVYLNSDGKVYKADSSNLLHAGKVVGFTISSCILNDSVLIRKLGLINLTGWALTPNSNYFVGTDGAITLTVPSTGFIQSVGIAKTTTDLDIQLSQIILRG